MDYHIFQLVGHILCIFVGKLAVIFFQLLLTPLHVFSVYEYHIRQHHQQVHGLLRQLRFDLHQVGTPLASGF
jgi:hypothetical protein